MLLVVPWVHIVLTSMVMKVKVGNLRMISILLIQDSMVWISFQQRSIYIELSFCLGNWTRFIKFAQLHIFSSILLIIGSQSFMFSKLGDIPCRAWHSAKRMCFWITSLVCLFYLSYQTGTPFVVFVASCDIRAGIELTLDYNPKAAEKELKKGKKGKTREKIPEGAMTCLCGSSQCRGYL